MKSLLASPLMAVAMVMAVVGTAVSCAPKGRAPIGVELGQHTVGHRGRIHTDWGNEGALQLTPAGGHDPSTVRLVEPSVASMTFADHALAVEIVAEANASGERMCMADLGPQAPEFRGARWWVFSC